MTAQETAANGQKERAQKIETAADFTVRTDLDKPLCVDSVLCAERLQKGYLLDSGRRSEYYSNVLRRRTTTAESKANIKYEKPRCLTCRDCRQFNLCLEASRLYPCRDFKPKTKGGKNEKQGNETLF